MSPADRVRLPVIYARHVVKRKGDNHLGVKMSHGDLVCVALRGTIGGIVSCKIYDVRPDVCRTFARGGSECLWAREEAGLSLVPGAVDV